MCFYNYWFVGWNLKIVKILVNAGFITIPLDLDATLNAHKELQGSGKWLAALVEHAEHEKMKYAVYNK